MKIQHKCYSALLRTPTRQSHISHNRDTRLEFHLLDRGGGMMVNTMVLDLWRYLKYLQCRTHFPWNNIILQNITLLILIHLRLQAPQGAINWMLNSSKQEWIYSINMTSICWLGLGLTDDMKVWRCTPSVTYYLTRLTAISARQHDDHASNVYYYHLAAYRSR